MARNRTTRTEVRRTNHHSLHSTFRIWAVVSKQLKKVDKSVRFYDFYELRIKLLFVETKQNQFFNKFFLIIENELKFENRTFCSLHCIISIVRLTPMRSLQDRYDHSSYSQPSILNIENNFYNNLLLWSTICSYDRQFAPVIDNLLLWSIMQNNETP